jgi:hypothetical protein
MLSKHDQAVEDVSKNIDVTKQTCKNEKCNKLFWAPVFFSLNQESIPTILCENCLLDKLLEEGNLTDDDKEKVGILYEAARNKVN